jgi:hypothetical protein
MKTTAFLTTVLSAFALSVPAHALSPQAVQLKQDLRAFQIALDSGSDPSAATQQLSDALQTHSPTLEDLQAYLKESLSPSEYSSFTEELDAGLQGVDPSQITEQEWNEILAQAIRESRSTGLAWDSCVATRISIDAVGIGLIVFGVVEFVRAHGAAADEASQLDRLGTIGTVSGLVTWGLIEPIIRMSDGCDP